MRKAVLSLVVLALAAAPLAACTADAGQSEKEVAELRTELQRLRRESDTQKEQIGRLERRLSGLSDDLPRGRSVTREVTIDSVVQAPAPGESASAAVEGAAAGAGGATEAGGAVVATAGVPAIKAFLTSEDGIKTVGAAVKAVQEQQDQERVQGQVDRLIARLAKDAQLTEDQSAKMKEILSRSAAQMRPLFQPFRDGGGDPSPEGRQQMMTKITELRTSTNAEVKNVLAQSQYEVYEKQIPQAFGGFGGFGGAGGAGGGGRPGRPGN